MAREDFLGSFWGLWSANMVEINSSVSWESHGRLILPDFNKELGRFFFSFWAIAEWCRWFWHDVFVYWYIHVYIYIFICKHTQMLFWNSFSLELFFLLSKLWNLCVNVLYNLGLGIYPKSGGLSRFSLAGALSTSSQSSSKANFRAGGSCGFRIKILWVLGICKS